MDELLRTANEGQILRRGIRAAIVGRPNVGKSSLLNQLLGRDRAIVSPIPGTTRDTIEETANIRGLPVVFIDTAGLREARDEIEQEGIRRSRESLARAEFILHVLDASEPLASEDEIFFTEFAAKKRILVRNKIDLPLKLKLPPEPSVASHGSRVTTPAVDISCLSGQGIERLKDAIKELVWAGEIKAEMLQVMINSRHQDALNRAARRLNERLTRYGRMQRLNSWRWICALRSTPSAKLSARRPQKTCLIRYSAGFASASKCRVTAGRRTRLSRAAAGTNPAAETIESILSFHKSLRRQEAPGTASAAAFTQPRPFKVSGSVGSGPTAQDTSAITKLMKSTCLCA